MTDHRLDIGAVFERIWLVVKSSPVAVIIFVLVTTIVGTASDLSGTGEGIGLLLESVTSFVGAYFMLGAMLRNVGLVSADKPDNFGSYFGVSFLAGLGTVIGYLLLVIPGLVLTVRWLPAVSLVLVEDAPVSDSLAKSWDMTKPHFWPLLGSVLIGFVVFGVLVVFLAFQEDVNDPAYLSSLSYRVNVILENFVSMCLAVFSDALGLATYWLLRADRRDLQSVFA